MHNSSKTPLDKLGSHVVSSSSLQRNDGIVDNRTPYQPIYDIQGGENSSTSPKHNDNVRLSNTLNVSTNNNAAADDHVSLSQVKNSIEAIQGGRAAGQSFARPHQVPHSDLNSY